MAKGKKYDSQFRPNEGRELTLIANGHWRDLVSWHQLPAKAREYFDYVTDEDERYSSRFFEYLGAWYDSSEFERIGTVREFAVMYRWHGIQSDSFFSGVLIKYDIENDYERVTVGRFYV